MSDTRFDLQRAADLEDELLAEFRSSASAVATRFQAYRREIAKCYAEIDRLTADREEWRRDAGKLAESSVKAACVTRARETIDGVECERIRGLDVIVPVGLIQDGDMPKEVRSWRLTMPSSWLDRHGDICRATDEMLRESPGVLAILLADGPTPATVPTWTPPASLPDGEYESADEYLESESNVWSHDVSPLRWKDFTKPANGRWRVESGRAVYLGPNEVTQ